MKIINLKIRGEDHDVKVEISPAEPEVGIMARYPVGWEVVDHLDWTLTAEEMELLFNAVADGD